MIGREEKKAELIKQILHPENRLIVLHAATGYGKKTLAVVTAYELIDKHDFTCIYVGSDGTFTVEDLAIKILTTCGIPAPSFGEKEKVMELFKVVTRKCLLILVNFDHTFHKINPTNIKPKQFSWANTTRKEEFQMFIEDVLRYTSSLTILATTWQSFSFAVTTKEVELPPLTWSDSKELFLSMCESKVQGIKRSSIQTDLLNSFLECCGGIPQLLLNAVLIVKKVGFETDSLASIPPERQLEMLYDPSLKYL